MARKFLNINEYIAANRLKKVDFAVSFGISRYQLSGLLDPQKYPVVLTDELVQRLAELLNQSPNYVRKMYPRAKAA